MNRDHHCAKRTDMDFDDRPEPAIRLEKAREKRGFRSARAAANYFGWNYHTYYHHESGIRGFHKAAEKYARAFRVSEAWLLTGEGSDSPAECFEPDTIRSAVHTLQELVPAFWRDMSADELASAVIAIARMIKEQPEKEITRLRMLAMIEEDDSSRDDEKAG